MRSPFDYVTSVTLSKKYMMDDEDGEKGYVPYMVNRSLGQFNDTIMAANAMNLTPMLDKKMQYDLYYHLIPKRKRFAKWAKPDVIADIEVVEEFFGYSTAKARDALKVLTSAQISEMKKSLYKGGRSAYRKSK